MSVKDILEIEKRNEYNLYEIHLYLEGIFWKAYEWSAYLSNKFPSPLNNDERLKPLKKNTKNAEYVSVGLPLSSFYKYFPNVIGDDTVFEMNEKHIIIHCGKFFGNEFSIENYEDILSKWKDGIEVKQKNDTKSDATRQLSNVDALLEEIVSYPIESKSLIENLQFLSHIKNVAMEIKNNK